MSIRFRISALLAAAALPALTVAAHPGGHETYCPADMPESFCIAQGMDVVSYEVGKELPAGYGKVTQWDRYDLPAPPEGQAYSNVDGDIVLYDEESMIVLKVARKMDSSF